MKWYKNKPIATKLIIGFLIVAVLAAAIGVIGIITVSNIAVPRRFYTKETPWRCNTAEMPMPPFRSCGTRCCE